VPTETLTVLWRWIDRSVVARRLSGLWHEYRDARRYRAAVGVLCVVLACWSVLLWLLWWAAMLVFAFLVVPFLLLARYEPFDTDSLGSTWPDKLKIAAAVLLAGLLLGLEMDLASWLFGFAL
jgi:hypothetical protein